MGNLEEYLLVVDDKKLLEEFYRMKFRIIDAERFATKVRDGHFHHKEHPDEPCLCNEKAAAEFLSGLTKRAADWRYALS